MDNAQLADIERGGLLNTGDEGEGIDAFTLELSEFRSAMPETARGLGPLIVERAFRMIYDAVEEHEPVIDIGEMADYIIISLREMNVAVMHSYRERLCALLEAAMRFLAEGYGYIRRESESFRADITRLIWPYVTRRRGPAGAVGSLADAVLGYYDSHAEISTADAADFVSERCPGVLDLETMGLLMNEIFDFLCEKGQLREGD